MMFDPKNYPPLEFVNELNEKNHTILLYDKPEYGKAVQYRFTENGLKKGEHCICLTHDDIKFVEKEMTDYGIDVGYYKQKKLLHVYQIENIMGYPEGIAKGFDDIIKRVTSDSKPPYWIVGRIIPNVSTIDGIETELEVERLLHKHFDKYECSFLCSYNLDEIEDKKRTIWLQRLFEYHHNLIYASEPEKSVIFELDLLNSA